MYYLRRWKNAVFLLWHIKTLRNYLQAILAVSDDQAARSIAAAGLAHDREFQSRLTDP
jgi:hypothetical protein